MKRWRSFRDAQRVLRYCMPCAHDARLRDCKVHKGGLEGAESGVRGGVEPLLLDKLPQPFTQVEMGRRGGQNTAFHVSRRGGSPDECTGLLARSGPEDGEGHAQLERGQLTPEVAPCRGWDVGGMSHGAECRGKRS